VADAIVIGAGPNGLVAANLLADAGWEVLVLEEQPEPGGAVRSGELTLPGYVHDGFSSFYPLGVASPVMRAMELERHGVRWRRHPAAVGHPAPDGSAALLAGDVEETCASLDAFAPGDGDAFRRWYAYWERISGPLLDTLTRPFPPLRGAARLAGALGPRGLLELGRLGLLSVRGDLRPRALRARPAGRLPGPRGRVGRAVGGARAPAGRARADRVRRAR
jgi:phytoene dehydrogenase-like protein